MLYIYNSKVCYNVSVNYFLCCVYSYKICSCKLFFYAVDIIIKFVSIFFYAVYIIIKFVSINNYNIFVSCVYNLKVC